MKRILIALAILCALPARADMVASNGNDSVRLTTAPCPAEVLQLIPQGHRGWFRAAHAILGGTSYIACWAPRLDGLIALRYADGDEGLLDFSVFKEDPGT